MASERVRGRMLAALHAAGYDDLDFPHLNVLQYPGPHGMRPSALAERLGVSKQALNYLLGELERLGYLERAPDPDDLRSRRIALTERGRGVIPVIRATVAEVERDWAALVGVERFEELRATLLELNGLASPRAEA